VLCGWFPPKPARGGRGEKKVVQRGGEARRKGRKMRGKSREGGLKMGIVAIRGKR